MIRKSFFSILIFVGSTLAHAQKAEANLPSSDRVDGSRIVDFQSQLKGQYPNVTSVQEKSLLPLESGGTTLMGLVSRLLGEAPNSEYEGLRIRRYFYYLNDKSKKLVGVVHGSGTNTPKGPINIFVNFDPEGTVNAVRTEGLPNAIEKELNDKGYLSQFIGKNSNDFEINRKGKKGRIKVVPAFLSQIRKPGSSEARLYFDKILRAVRFNVCFMDVAYFITQHPDLADKPTEEFPAAVQVTTQQPLTGPEAFAREKASTAFQDRVNIFQSLPTPKN